MTLSIAAVAAARRAVSKARAAWLLGAICCSLLGRPATAADSAEAVVQSEQWQAFKNLLARKDVRVSDVSGLDALCLKHVADLEAQGSATKGGFPECVEKALSAVGSASEMMPATSQDESPPKERDAAAGVVVRHLQPQILYIGLARLYTESTLNAVRQIRTLERQTDLKYKRVILDLRGNPGGSLVGATFTAGVLLGEGEKAFKVLDKLNQVTELDTTLDAEPYPGRRSSEKVMVPNLRSKLKRARYAVIIDRETGAGAEALAYLLQQKGAHIFGENSAGNTEIYSIQNIADGYYLKLHVGVLYAANDRNWARAGVIPDVVISDPRVDRDDIGAPSDAWLQSAIGHLR